MEFINKEDKESIYSFTEYISKYIYSLLGYDLKGKKELYSFI